MAAVGTLSKAATTTVLRLPKGVDNPTIFDFYSHPPWLACEQLHNSQVGQTQLTKTEV